ncbi:MAG: MarR family transcriptional regulator, partial [Coriobacteriales bacterium]|nr:MarR family transcriptional regulator [Coriobacteriales bacterium]
EIIVGIQEHSDVLQHKNDGILEGLNLAEVHCIDRIGIIEKPNVTKVAKELRLTRGAISKISKKLLDKLLIESYQDPNNKKEIYFRLTKDGKTLFRKHQSRHKEVRDKWLSLFECYSDFEQAAILCFLTDVSDLLIGMDDGTGTGTDKSFDEKAKR